MPSEPPKRKACDLCYRKKLKCDGQLPRCSSCVLYDSACTHKALSRKRRDLAARREAKGLSLQQQLNEALAKVERLEKAAAANGLQQPTKESDAVPTKRRSHREFPPAEEALPLVETFLGTFNSVFPLFDPQVILRTFKAWYASPGRSDSKRWALVNVVLALAHHTGCSTEGSNGATYLHDAQSVLSEVISGDVELVNVQIAVGLAIVFWNVHDIEPSLILTATALRLAHRLGLHSRALSDHNLRPEDRAQGRRVFWMVYIIDRKISDLASVAPIQLDSDIDIDLPPSGLGEGLAGFLFSADGDSAFNFFRARVQLAQIQGKVYETVYSVSAKYATTQERSHSIAQICEALDEWSESIPAAFRPYALAQAECPVALARYLSMLYAARLTCRAKISHASTLDVFHFSQWMTLLQEHGDREPLVGGLTPACTSTPQRWQTLVDESRDFMWMYSSVSKALRDAAFLSLSQCAYFTGLICLLANSIRDARLDFLQSDQKAIDEAWADLEEIGASPNATHLRLVCHAVGKLKTLAGNVSEKRNDLLSWAVQDPIDIGLGVWQPIAL